jgi:acetyl-CoA C-acetyltransferase
VQLNRFCASGLEAVNIAAQKVASGWEDLVFAGGVESMSRVPMGSDGGAWALDPETNYDTSFVPQGISADLIATVEEFSREDVDAYAARSQERAATAQAEGRFANSVIPVLDINEHVVLDNDEFIRPGTTVETLGKLKPSFQVMGEMGGFDAVALQKYHWIEKIEHVHTPGNSSGIVDGASLVAIGNEQIGHELGLTPRAADPRDRRLGRRPDDHAHRPGAREPQGPRQGRPDRSRTSTWSRSTRRSRRWCCGSSRTWASTSTRSTSTAARSRWAIRSARPAR